MTSLPPPLTPATLEWKDNGTPVATGYDDVYFSADDGLAESEFVFLQGNQLAKRFAALAPGAPFTIVETGFGTGLNFLLTWRCFLAHAPTGATLHYVSIEAHPLRVEDATQALSHFPATSEQATAWLQAYPLPIPGMHHRTFDAGRVCITLCYGEVSSLLPELQLQANAWFLDGFAPAKNPDMWVDSLYREMVRLSAPDATVATFTAAGAVKRGIQQAGFVVEKAPGYGRKRDRLLAHLPNAITAPAIAYHTPKDIAVLGAGIAGATVAHALAECGMSVTIYEAAEETASKASGNPAAAFVPYLSADWSARSQFYLAAFLHSHRYYTHMQMHFMDAPFFYATTALAMATTPERAEKQQKYLERLCLPKAFLHAVTQQEASTLANTPLPCGGLYYPLAGWVQMKQLCKKLLQHPNIKHHYGCTITNITEGAQPQLHDSASTCYRHDAVVIANGDGARTLPICTEFPLEPVRGQLLYTTEENTLIDTNIVLNYSNYITPSTTQPQVLGSTYQRHETDTAIRADDTTKLIKDAATLFAPPIATDDTAQIQSWVGIRSASKDRTPIIGKLHENIYCSLAHGSRATLTAPLAASIICAELHNIPLPIAASVAHIASPKRYSCKPPSASKKPSIS